MMESRLAILGASGHGKVVADAALASGWSQVFFFDDAWPECLSDKRWPVIGNTATLAEALAQFDGVVVAIGDNLTRARKMRELEAFGGRLATIVHPSAVISRFATLSAGTVVFAGAVINTDATLGAGAIVNTGATIDHDCVLGEAVHVSPGANLAGGVIVGAHGWIGIGACVAPRMRIGERAVVGAGASVIRDVPDDVTVVGIPAKPIERK